MTQKVADIRAHLNENIVHAARIIGRSRYRKKVFEAIYRGKKAVKAVSEIMRATGMGRVRVLQEASKLAANGIVEQTRCARETGYRKDRTLSDHKRKILSIVESPTKASKYPTQQSPRVSGTAAVRITIQSRVRQPREITVDDVESFNRIRAFPTVRPNTRLNRIAEKRIKRALKGIIGENHEFKDWGGEKNDLFTNKLKLGGARRAAAFAIKGKATQGTLTPKKMGFNGDQIARLFGSAAEVFFVVYHGKVDESVHEQMRVFGFARSFSGRPVCYGVIDGDDLNRLRQAYARHF